MQKTKSDIEAEKQGCYYDAIEAEKIIKFAHKYCRPQFIRGEFQLLEWQQEWLRQLTGWRQADGTRRYKRALLHIAKKQGKTLLVVILALYELFFSDLPSPIICSGSTSQSNAKKQVFKEIAHSIAANAQLSKVAKIRSGTNEILYDKKNAMFFATSCEGKSIAGLNISCAIEDECAFARNSTLHEQLEHSTIARQGEALHVMISTASQDMNGWYYQQYRKAKRIIAGDEIDTQFFATVYEASPDGDLENDRRQWLAANPSMGTSFCEQQFAADLKSAKSNIADWNNFKRLRLNIWTSGADEAEFIDMLQWDKLESHPTDLDRYPCVLGIDLSESLAPSAVAQLFLLPNKRYYLRGWGWVCKKATEERHKASLPLYSTFPNLKMTEGAVIDKNLIVKKILELNKDYNVKAALFDTHSAFLIMNELIEQGIECFRIVCNPKNLNDPMKEFASAVNEGRLTHDGCAYLRWGLSCIRVRTNNFGEVAPDRERSKDYIDIGVASLLTMLMACNLQNSATQVKSVYDKRGILTLDF